MKLVRKLFSILVATVFLATCVIVPAQAAMVTTNKISTQVQLQETRANINQFLAREDVKQQLLESGVSPEEVTARVASLSALELEQLSNRIDELPAGGTDVLGVIVFLFLVLLVTDIMGLTDIFPFVRKPR